HCNSNPPLSPGQPPPGGSAGRLNASPRWSPSTQSSSWSMKNNCAINCLTTSPCPSWKMMAHIGSRLLVFVWSSFWWLDYYRAFHRYLREHFPCLSEDNLLLIFDLQNPLGQS